MSGAEQCALTFGVPVDREEFDLHAGASDYLAAAGKAGTEGLWESQYERVANAAQTLIETAGRVGARVYRRAGLREIAAASGAFRTVILIAHFPGIMVRPEDFPNGVAPVLRRIAAHPLLRDHVRAGGDANQVADDLNRVVADRSLIAGLPRAVAQAATRSRAVGSVLCRDLLDEILENDIKPGNRVELFDGLHTLAEIEEAISALFTGTLDLALCNSDAISTFLELRRNNRLRILHWPDYVFPVPQIVKVEAALRRMQGDYARTRLQIEEEEHLGGPRRIIHVT